jgi:hypothetical protein
MQELEMDLRIRLTESQYEALKTVAEASGDTLDEYLHTVKRISIYILDTVKLSNKSCTRNLLQNERRNTNVLLPIFFLCSTLQVHNY